MARCRGRPRAWRSTSPCSGSELMRTICIQSKAQHCWQLGQTLPWCQAGLAGITRQAGSRDTAEPGAVGCLAETLQDPALSRGGAGPRGEGKGSNETRGLICPSHSQETLSQALPTGGACCVCLEVCVGRARSQLVCTAPCTQLGQKQQQGSGMSAFPGAPVRASPTCPRPPPPAACPAPAGRASCDEQADERAGAETRRGAGKP